MLVIRVDQNDFTLQKIVSVSYNKSRFVIICHSHLIPPTNIPAVSQKEISYFSPGKGLCLSKEMKLGISLHTNFLHKKRKNLQNSGTLFFMLLTKEQKFQWEN